MAHTITLELEAPPETVAVAVDFYDDDEKKAFLASPIADLVRKLPVTLELPTTDICAYYLYYKRRLGIDGYNTHDDIVQQWAEALAEFKGQLKFGNTSLRLTSATNMSSGTTDRVGESIGLSVASNLHDLHQADWDRISITNTRKTLDFERLWTASDGKQFVQVETKGSATKDNNYKTSSVSAHKAGIKAKKKDATDEERKKGVLYGTIAVLDDRPDSIARCWLVDPPQELEGDPRRYKILTRLRYIADLVSFLASRSSLSASLQTRLAALDALPDISSLDRIPLKKGNAKDYPETTFDAAREHNPWFAGKSVVSDGAAGGQVYRVDAQTVMFIGLREELVVYATQQDFSVIEKYHFPAGTVAKTVECVVPTGRFKREFQPVIQIPDEGSSSSGGYVRFNLAGSLHYTQSGFIIGVLPVPESWQRR